MPSAHRGDPRRKSFGRRLLLAAIILSGFWILLTASFVWLERQAMRDQLAHEASALSAGVDASLAIMEREMLHFATFIASDPVVKLLMKAGREAVREEGGGAGGPRAAEIRQALYEYVGPRWLALQQRYDARQLHFHLPDDFVSFLRVHEPGQYGDSLAPFRRMVIEANTRVEPVTGFEIGRVYSGVRGLVPIMAPQPDGGVHHVGTVETGLSFLEMIEAISSRYNAELAVLLRADQVDGVTWESHIREHGLQSLEDCDCYLEAVSSPLARELVAAVDRPGRIEAHGYRLVSIKDRWYSVIRVPLRQFAADGSDLPAGSVAIFSDRSDLVMAYRDHQIFSVLVALVTFLLSMLVVTLLLRRTVRGLESEVQSSQRALASSERFTSSLFDAAPDSVMVLDARSRILAVNRQFEVQTGYAKAEALGRHPDELLSCDQTDQAVLDELKRTVAAGEIWRGEVRARGKHGRYYWSLESVSPVLDEAGNIEGFVAFQRDVTDRVATREALADRERQFRLITENMTDKVSLHDLDGRYLYVSPSAHNLLGHEAASLIGRDAYALVHPDDRDRLRQAVHERLLAGKAARLVTYRIQHRDGHWCWLESRAQAVRDESGRITAIQTVSRDVTDRVRVERQLAERERLYRNIFEHVQEAIFLVDVLPDGGFRFRGTNPEHARATGIPTDELAGRRPEEILPADTAKFVTANYRECLHGGEPLRYVEELALPGGLRTWSTVLTPVRNEQGRIDLIVGLSVDLTEEKKLLEQLRENSRQLEHAQRLAHVGSWEWDMRANTVRWTDETFRIFDLPPRGVQPSVELYLNHIHEDDRPRIERHMAAAMAGEREYRYEYRLVTHLGRVKQVVVEGELRRDGDGQPIGVIGTVQDITARKQAEEAVMKVSRENALILETAGEGIVGMDEHGRVTFINPAALAMLGLDEEAARGRHVMALFRDEAPRLPDSGWPRVLRDGQTRQAVQDTFRRADGESFPVRLSVTAVGGERIEGAVCVFFDITELKQAEDRLRTLASTDELTGLPNRRHFLERAEAELHRVRRYGEQASLLMIDLDHFKQINDRHGHAVGDEALRRFAALCRATFRQSDLPGRLGGEEFAVLLPSTDEQGAREIGQRLRREVAALRLDVGGDTVSVTISLGGTLLSARDEGIEQVLARADEALYTAKQQGRDRLCWLSRAD